MRIVLFLYTLLVFSCVAAPVAADHVPIGGVAPLSFACEKSASIIGMIEAPDNAAANVILADAECFKFTNTPAIAVRYVGTYIDPVNGNVHEVYEVQLRDRSVFYTSVTVPSEAT